MCVFLCVCVCVWVKSDDTMCPSCILLRHNKQRVPVAMLLLVIWSFIGHTLGVNNLRMGKDRKINITLH